jgi:hypothetical protein
MTVAKLGWLGVMHESVFCAQVESLINPFEMYGINSHLPILKVFLCSEVPMNSIDSYIMEAHNDNDPFPPDAYIEDLQKIFVFKRSSDDLLTMIEPVEILFNFKYLFSNEGDANYTLEIGHHYASGLLRDALLSINPGMPNDVLDRAMQILADVRSGGTLDLNEDNVYMDVYHEGIPEMLYYQRNTHVDTLRADQRMIMARRVQNQTQMQEASATQRRIVDCLEELGFSPSSPEETIQAIDEVIRNPPARDPDADMDKLRRNFRKMRAMFIANNTRMEKMEKTSAMLFTAIGNLTSRINRGNMLQPPDDTDEQPAQPLPIPQGGSNSIPLSIRNQMKYKYN